MLPLFNYDCGSNGGCSPNVLYLFCLLYWEGATSKFLMLLFVECTYNVSQFRVKSTLIKYLDKLLNWEGDLYGLLFLFFNTARKFVSTTWEDGNPFSYIYYFLYTWREWSLWPLFLLFLSQYFLKREDFWVSIDLILYVVLLNDFFLSERGAREGGPYKRNLLHKRTKPLFFLWRMISLVSPAW